MGSEGRAVLERERSVPESDAGESAMSAWTVHSRTAGKACQCQTCGQGKIAACAALERAPKLINPQLWMARHNICVAHFDLECVLKIPEYAISGGAISALQGST